MATKKTNDAPTEALARRTAPEPLAIYDPGLAAGDEAGMENLTSQDVKLPFLAIAQKTSKVIDRTEGKYIEGLEFGEMYNSETREIFGGGPIEFIPVLLGKRARLKGENGILGDVIPWEDPRCIPPWEPGSKVTDVEECDGVRIYDWAVLLLPSLDTIIISFKSTSFSAGKSLNTILDKYRKLAKLAGKGFRPYQVKCALSTFIDKNDAGSFGKFKIEPAGGPTPIEYAFADAWFQAIKDKTLVTEEEDGGGSNGDVIDAEPVRQRTADDKVPF